jgi:hypothetical protein
MKTLAPVASVKKSAPKLRAKPTSEVATPHLKPRAITPLLETKPGSVVRNSVKITKTPPPSQFEDHEEPKPLLQWPTDTVLRETTRNLLAIKSAGVEYENIGDYFNSGDLAYQLQEILHNIQDLTRKTERIREAKNS